MSHWLYFDNVGQCEGWGGPQGKLIPSSQEISCYLVKQPECCSVCYIIMFDKILIKQDDDQLRDFVSVVCGVCNAVKHSADVIAVCCQIYLGGTMDVIVFIQVKLFMLSTFSFITGLLQNSYGSRCKIVSCAPCIF